MGPSGARGCDSLTALLPACEIQHTRSVTAVSGGAFARDSWVICWLAKIYWAGPFLRLSEACATLAALFPSRQLYVFETLATPGRAQPPSYLKAFSSPRTPMAPRSEGIPPPSARGVSVASMSLCVSVFTMPGACSYLVQHMYQVDTKKQACGTRRRSSVVQALASSGQDLLRTRELGHATSPSVPHGVMR